MKRWAMAAGGVLIAGAGVWQWLVVPRVTARLPEGWRWSAEFVGVISYADPATGRFGAADPPALYIRQQEVLSRTADSVSVRDTYRVRDVSTGKTAWEYILDARVDPRTGAHLDDRYRGDQFVFPRRVEKKAYRLRFNYVKGYEMSFVREEPVDGLLTYVFEFLGKAEYTESYAGTARFEGVKTAPGQQIRCGDDRFVLRMWVEPDTGELARLEESCFFGDYIFDRDGRRLSAVARWGGTTAGDELTDRVERIKRERIVVLSIGRYAAPGFLAIGLVALVAVTLRERSGRP